MDSGSTGRELPKGRLMSLDAFRGLTIAGMIPRCGSTSTPSPVGPDR